VMATDWEQASGMVGETVIGKNHQRIGKVRGIAEKALAMEPAFLVVSTSPFGRERLVPIELAMEVDGHLRVPLSKEMVVQSPEPMTSLALSASEEDALVRHYRRAA
jgi:hypothetical protein